MEILNKLFSITVVVFMVGNLLDMGLKLNLAEAGKAIRHVRFLVLSLLWSFVLGPALAVLLTKIVPLTEPYALGLLFLGMAPCAPFVPKVSEKARADLSYVAVYMAVAAVGTVIFMPLAVPVLVKGFSASAWTIAKPLLFFIAIPLVIGTVIRQTAQPFAAKAQPIVRRLTDIDTIILLVVILILDGKPFLSMVGSYAIGTQFLYYAVLMAASYGLGFGLSPGQKSVIALGIGTRNTGAALAPLLAVAGTDQRAVVMCLLSIFITVITGFSAAALFARLARAEVPKGAPGYKEGAEVEMKSQ